ncbi:MAG: hypothetical protein WC332_00215 [Clostridia bacterium]|jgi:hypothetical protein
MSEYENYQRPKKIESICTICKATGRKYVHKGWSRWEYCKIHRMQTQRGDYPDTMSEIYPVHS